MQENQLNPNEPPTSPVNPPENLTLGIHITEWWKPMIEVDEEAQRQERGLQVTF